MATNGGWLAMEQKLALEQSKTRAPHKVYILCVGSLIKIEYNRFYCCDYGREKNFRLPSSVRKCSTAHFTVVPKKPNHDQDDNNDVSWFLCGFLWILWLLVRAKNFFN
uniref:Uncharacterized protein n=1 Tax=Glossina austeni TaxID=7395 RepID=A0A1A9VB65_GLOAU